MSQSIYQFDGVRLMASSFEQAYRLITRVCIEHDLDVPKSVNSIKKIETDGTEAA